MVNKDKYKIKEFYRRCYCEISTSVLCLDDGIGRHAALCSKCSKIFQIMSTKRKWTENLFIYAVKNSKSYAEVIKKLGLKIAGSNYDTVKNKIKQLNLDTSHMTHLGWNVNLNFKPNQSKPLSEILTTDSTFNTNNLRIRLIKEGLKEHKCEMCNLTKWLNKPIPLELHHINGIKTDLRIENLQLLCPNCHALTDNYRGKKLKVKSAQEETLDVEAG